MSCISAEVAFQASLDALHLHTIDQTQPAMCFLLPARRRCRASTLTVRPTANSCTAIHLVHLSENGHTIALIRCCN